MPEAKSFVHTVVVSSVEAFGYLQAADGVPCVQVETLVPCDPADADRLVAMHVGTLFREHKPPLGEREAFVEEAAAAVRGAFDGPDADGVLVRITTPLDDGTVGRLNYLAVCAATVQMLPE